MERFKSWDLSYRHDPRRVVPVHKALKHPELHSLIDTVTHLVGGGLETWMTAMLYIQKAFRVSIRCSLGKTEQSDQTDVLYIPEPGLKLFVQYLCFFD